MSQTATQPGPSQAGVSGAAASPGTRTAPVDQPESVSGVNLREDVPALLNRWQLIAVVTCVLFGVLVALLQSLSWQANGRAADNAQQLVRVQELQSSLFRADALASNAFLVGGLESPAQRAEYDAALEQVQRDITDAARAQPADADALAQLNVAVAAYASDVAQARDNNRLGLPVGAAYLTDAGQGLRADVVPILTALVDANTDRVVTEIGGQHPWLILAVGVLALLVLWWVNRQLATRFRRRINLGVAAAAVGVLVITLIGVGYAAVRDSNNSDVADGSLQRAFDGAQTRTAANDAKANEARRLIQRGSGQAFEDAWFAASATVDENLTRTGYSDAWNSYVDAHNQIVALDEGGDWDAAVALATDPAEQSTRALTAFDADSRELVTDASLAATQDLRNGGPTALLLILLTLVVAGAAAGAVTAGINQRRKEFS